MKSIAKRKPEKVVYVACPTCQRVHRPDRQFGMFCCASCLQTAIRPLILATPEMLEKLNA